MNIQFDFTPIETMELVRAIVGIESSVATDKSVLSGLLPNEVKTPLKCVFSFGTRRVINMFFDIFKNRNSFFSSRVQSILKKNNIEIDIGKIDIQTTDSNSYITGMSVEITKINYNQVIKRILAMALNLISKENNNQINGILEILDDEKDEIVDFILDTVSDDKKEKIICQLLVIFQDKIVDKINTLAEKNGLLINVTQISVD